MRKIIEWLKCVRKKKFQASFTVEAAVIVPLFFLTFVLSVGMIMYSYDVAVIENLEVKTILEREESDYEKESGLKQDLAGKTFFLTNPEIQMNLDRDGSGSVKVNAAFAMKVPWVRGMERLERVAAIKGSDPARFVRIIRALKEFGTKEGTR